MTGNVFLDGLLSVLIYALCFVPFILLGIIKSVVDEALDRRRKRKLSSTPDGSASRRVLARLRRLARPTLLLTPTKEPGFSKVGGLPEMPADMAWPMGDRAPCVFVAQIDFAAFRPHVDIDWLPTDGRIYAFFDDERNGAKDVVQIIYSRDLPGPERPSTEPLAKQWRFKERRIGFMPFTSLPSLDWLSIDYGTLELEDDDLDRLEEELNLFGDEIEHRIGGYPGEIQGGQMGVECEYMRRGLTRNYDEEVPDAILRASKQWHLLLQIDSDPVLDMNWWDAGRLYVFIREKDARAGDFSKTVTITQTH